MANINSTYHFFLAKKFVFFLAFLFLFNATGFSQVITKVNNGTTSIDVKVNASQTGTLYYSLYKSAPSQTAPSDIKNDALSNGNSNIVRNGILTVGPGQAGIDLTKQITNLGDNTSYQLYGVFESGGSLGAVQNFSLSMGVRHLSTSYLSQLSGQVGTKVRYWIYRPESYYKNPGKTYPVLMFYHGLGELGQNDWDINKVLANGPPKLISQGQEMEFIVVSPQAYNDGWGIVRYGTPGWLNEVLEQVKSTDRVDVNRVYATGLSLGGRAVYNIAGDEPGKISAMLTASGVYDNYNTCVSKNIPYWGFANDGDPVVGYNWNLARYIRDVNSCVPAPTMPHLTTVYSSGSHDSWSAMYGTNDVYQWMLSKTKTNPSNSVLTVSAGNTANITTNTFTFSSSSSSPNGSIIFYEWTKRQGPDVTIINPNSANASLQDIKKGTYIFRLFITDSNGASAYADVTINADPSSDSQAPSAPGNLISTGQTFNSISLAWDASTDNIGVTGYNIYQGATLAGSVGGTINTFTVNSLNPNTSYSFTVKAKDAAGNISPASNQLTISTKADTQAPSVPSALNSTGQTNTSISLAWAASSDNVGVTEYEIYQGGTQIGTTTGNTLTYTANGLIINTNYSFTISAKDVAGNISSQSQPLSISTTNILPDTQAPSVPLGLNSGNQTNNTISLSWNASIDNIGVAEYEIYQGGSQIGTTNGNTLTYTAIGLTINTNYSFTVSAKDAAGNISSQSQSLSVSTTNVLSDTQAPSAPSALSVSNQTSNSISLNWNASTDNVGVTGYNIYQGVTLIGSTTSALTYVANGLSANTSYDFTVFAIDAAGNVSPASNKITSSTINNPDTQAPSNPQNLSSNGKGVNFVSLIWDASNDNRGVSGYEIYSGLTLVGNSTINSFTVNNLNAATSYTFTVLAKDDANNKSGLSNPLIISTLASPDTQPPSAPAGLVSTGQTSKSISIKWSPSVDNVATTAYDIYNGNILINSVGGNINAFIIEGLNPGANLLITVKARDAAGNISSASNSVSVSALQNSSPVVSLGKDETITLPLDSLELSAQASDADNDPITYTWAVSSESVKLYPNNNNLKIKNLPSGNYTITVTATDSYQAKGTSSILIKVLNEEVKDTTKLLQAKKLFSPNGDGNNDEWSIKNKGENGSWKVNILNAMGNLVLAASISNKDEFVWDGRADGRDLPEGAYYYIVENLAKNAPESGSFILIR